MISSRVNCNFNDLLFIWFFIICHLIISWITDIFVVRFFDKLFIFVDLCLEGKYLIEFCPGLHIYKDTDWSDSRETDHVSKWFPGKV